MFATLGASHALAHGSGRRWASSKFAATGVGARDAAQSRQVVWRRKFGGTAPLDGGARQRKRRVTRKGGNESCKDTVAVGATIALGAYPIVKHICVARIKHAR
jgi:hypothetical protein